MTATAILLCLAFLFYSNRKIISEFSKLIHKFGGGSRVIIWLWSLIFLPGTVMHEISHFLAAAATGARTGKIEVFPEILQGNWQAEEEGRGVVLGYVQTQKLNPIRGFFVGLAPFIFGLIFLTGLALLLQTSYNSRTFPLFGLEIYLFFTIANSFFPSASDIKQTLPLAVILILLVLVALVLGVQLHPNPSPALISLFNTLGFALLISVILNTAVLLVLFVLNRLLKY